MYRYMMKELLVIVAGLSVCAFVILFFLVSAAHGV
ncbi:membrane protein [Ensifer adhaerens]|uniref:Membrane protein n=1 Tax=Ensifer adhaerens TaxID=106592 RepID=A0A0L8BZ76_ENSAD|nr:membrane protein [Ensifer adhaerens]